MGCTERKSGTTLLVAFEGWNDACQSATNVVRSLVAHYDSREVRHIACDGYYDYQSARPMMCHVTGRARIIWPRTTFFEIALDDGYRVFAQLAPEPNYRWVEYCRESLSIAQELDVDHVVTMGGMLAECPHTRPLPLDVSDSDRRCDMDREYNGPVGITTVFDQMAREDGFDASSMWVSVPQYLDCDECAQGTLQLTRRLSRLLGHDIDVSELVGQANLWRAQVDRTTSGDSDLADYVRRLEREYDARRGSCGPCGREFDAQSESSADELVRDVENYLRGLDS
ncbi:PAC2 family protein [uncultured Bifidobacterium sp.]|uniref:PAC2 family protein n=1 Tax=uncultured Bifidobacterium sp. TaxID=165187 RepID=UPI00263757C7|nr:PAC2 family protein [uncultured Bifidobacterium sp.]